MLAGLGLLARSRDFPARLFCTCLLCAVKPGFVAGAGSGREPGREISAQLPPQGWIFPCGVAGREM